MWFERMSASDSGRGLRLVRDFISHVFYIKVRCKGDGYGPDFKKHDTYQCDELELQSLRTFGPGSTLKRSKEVAWTLFR
jgi:hypothetical protein